MKKTNQKRMQRRADGYSALRVYHREQRGRKSPRLLIKCGDCDERFEIYYDLKGRDLEIAGVFGSVDNWREVLLPLLKKPARGKLSYRPLEEYLAESTHRDSTELSPSI